MATNINVDDSSLIDDYASREETLARNKANMKPYDIRGNQLRAAGRSGAIGGTVAGAGMGGGLGAMLGSRSGKPAVGLLGLGAGAALGGGLGNYFGREVGKSNYISGIEDRNAVISGANSLLNNPNKESILRMLGRNKLQEEEQDRIREQAEYEAELALNNAQRMESFRELLANSRQ